MKSFMSDRAKIPNHIQQELHYPAPLAVGFYNWGDQCAPMIRFSAYLSVPWDKDLNLPLSEAWSDANISSVLFAGSETGTIVVYKVLSEKQKIIDVVPLSLISAHQTKIVSLISYENIIYNRCIASLSEDGTFSIISVLDMTVVLNKPRLFTEHSQFLEAHESNYRLVMAAQEYGTIEAMDVINGSLVLRISGFTSIITSISHHGSLHGISCADGSVSVFTLNQNTAECLYNLKYAHHPGEEVRSCVSPTLTYILQMTSKTWSLFDSNQPIITKEIEKSDDIFIDCQWVTNEYFMLATLSGVVELWQVSSEASDVHVLDRVNSDLANFTVSGPSGIQDIETVIVNNSPDSLEPIHKPPTLVYSMEHSYEGPPSRVHVTVEGFVCYSPGKSVIILQNQANKFPVTLSTYFSSKTRCRCAIGDPIRHSAKIGVNSDVYLDGEFVGEHPDSFMLYSPPISADFFFTFSEDCSIRGWELSIPTISNSKIRYTSFHDLCESVRRVVWIEEKQWMVCIGQKSSFSVIDVKRMKSVMLCCGHNSPIVDVIYYNGLLHARCESTSIYAWNIDSQLVSRTKEKLMKKIGEVKELPSLPSMPAISRSEPNLHSQLIDKPITPFSKTVSLMMPNCQTFAIVLDIFAFLKSYSEYEALPIRTDPHFTTLIMLWKNHIGKEKLDFEPLGPLDDFNYAIAGDNFTITLPISYKSKKIQYLRRISSENKFDISQQTLITKQSMGNVNIDRNLKEKTVITPSTAFMFSPLLTAVHSLASSVVGQCFINRKNDEGIAIISALSQTQTSTYSMNCVRPSFYVLANWLDYPNESLRIIILNVIQDAMSSMSQEEQFELVKKIQQIFSSWPLILPFAFIYNKKYPLPTNFGQSAARKMIPTVFQHIELVDLLADCFPNFIQYITSIGDFYNKLLDAVQHKLIPVNKMISFALERPIDFLEIIQNNAQSPFFVDLIIERWLRPKRELMFDFLMKIIELQPKFVHINYEHMINTICTKTPFIGGCRGYIVYGSDEGEVIVISREKRKVIWNLNISSHPISFISVSPNGQRFIIVSIPDKMLTWVCAVAPGKGIGDPFELAGTTPINFTIVPSSSAWNGDVKITLKSHNEKLLDCSAPNLSFFQRLIPR